MTFAIRHVWLLALLMLAGCGQSSTPEAPTEKPHAEHPAGNRAEHDQDIRSDADDHDRDASEKVEKEAVGDGDADADEGGDEHRESEDHDQIRLSDAQIRAAGIELAVVGSSAGGATTVPGVIATDPARSAVVATAIGGRVRSLQRNVGDAVKAGDALVVLDSREAAEFSAELEAARQQQELARATLAREERLFAERVSPEVDVLAARAAAKEAEIRVRLAQDRIGATGGAASGTSSSLMLRSPIDGHVVSRTAQIGAAIGADTELFRVADLSAVTLEMALLPESASQVSVGRTVTVSSGGRSSSGRIAFVSPVIDPQTRQVRATASLPNVDGAWRIGETVEVSVPLGKATEGGVLSVPKSALQTVENKPTVFVRNAEGFKITHVEIGATAGDAVTVLSGLKRDDRIAVRNSFVLKAEAGKGEGGDDDD